MILEAPVYIVIYNPLFHSKHQSLSFAVEEYNTKCFQPALSPKTELFQQKKFPSAMALNSETPVLEQCFRNL